MSTKRASTRNVVLSKAMKHVDEETRREFRERRLQALECDNYVEMEAAQVDDDAYNESEDEKGGPGKRKRAKTNQKNASAIRSKWATKVVKPLERILLDNGIIREQLNRRPAATAEAMDVDGSDSDQGNVVEVTSAPSSSSSSSSRKGTNASRSSSAHNPAPSRGQPRSASAVEVKYHTIAAKASVFPARQCFCSVCGYIGHYSCTRCGSKFCSIKCNESHKETRCFKFSM